ncbi:DNA alkylation repair protein [Jannaschia seohaensis]|nr:DNA alkylation repair protein [Jannaschia seohaensis]
MGPETAEGGQPPAPAAPPRSISSQKKIEILARLRAAGSPGRAAKLRAANRTEREAWGVEGGLLSEMAQDLRAEISVDGRVLLADALWREGVLETRMLALKLLTQARMRPDHGAWDLLSRWVYRFDCRAVAEAGAAALARRLAAEPARLAVLDDWAAASNVWTRRCVFSATAGFAKGRHPSAEEIAARDKVVALARAMEGETRPVIRQAIDSWCTALARHDPERAAQAVARR